MSCGRPGEALRQSRKCAAKANAGSHKRALASKLKAEGLRALTAKELTTRGISRTGSYGGPIDPRQIDAKRSIPAGVDSGAAPSYTLLAATADNNLAIVRVTPRITVRTYKTCECPFREGVRRPFPPALFYVLPVGTSTDDVKRRVDVSYDALVITKRGVRRSCPQVS